MINQKADTGFFNGIKKNRQVNRSPFAITIFLPYFNRKIIYGFSFFILLLTMYSCENSEEEVKNITTKSLGVEEATNVNVNYTTGGKIKAKLFAPLMLRVQDTTSYVEFPKKLHVDFYNPATSSVESILDAKYGKYNELESKVLLRDSVRFIGLTNGDTLYTNELYWDRNRPVYQFYTDKPVVIITRSQIIHGIGFEVSEDFNDRWIKNTTNSYFRVPTTQFPNY